MAAAFLTTLTQMFRIIFFLFVGYMFNRLHLVQRSAEPVLSKFVAMLFIPSLTLYSNMVECRLDRLGTYASWVIIGGCMWLGCSLVGCVLAKWFGENNADQVGLYRYAFSFPNYGGVGTPLVLTLFGTAGLFQLNLFTFINGVMTYSWGTPQLIPHKEKMTLRRFLQKFFNLNFICMLLGMTLGVLGATKWMPSIVLEIFSDLGDCFVPVALLLTGFSIADYPFSDVFSNKKLYLYSLLRLIVFPCILLVILFVTKAPLMLATLTVLVYSCPCGMNVVVFPAAYDQDCKTGSGLVLVSSLGSVFTIPLIYSLVQYFF